MFRSSSLNFAGSLLAVAVAFAMPGVQAQEKQEQHPRSNFEETVTASSVFLEGHPDVRHRNHGVSAFRAGNYQDAERHFRAAARHADKASQAVLAEMYWDGIGVDQDRAIAYAWMDLAAERGSRTFIAKREFYWSRLGAADRARAIVEGQAIYAEYGDDIAQPRQERAMQRARRNVTGSRVGMVGALRISMPGPGGGIELSGDQIYQNKLWEPDQYWTWQDEVTEEALRTYTIRIGEIEDARVLPERSSGERD